MHPKNDVRKKIFVVATPITLSAMSWMVEIWTPEKHQKCDPQKGRGEYLIEEQNHQISFIFGRVLCYGERACSGLSMFVDVVKIGL